MNYRKKIILILKNHTENQLQQKISGTVESMHNVHESEIQYSLKENLWTAIYKEFEIKGKI